MKLPVSKMPRLHRTAVVCVAIATATGGALHAQSPAPAPVSATAADSPSVDFKEDATGYTVRIALSAADAAKLDLKMDGDRLKLTVPHGGSTFQQSFEFPEADLSKSPAIQREGNAVVISIPKAAADAAQSAPADPAAQQQAQQTTASPDNQTASAQPDNQSPVQTGDDAMDNQIAGAFAQMQRQMNAAMKAMQSMNGPNGFGDLLQDMQGGGDSAFSVEEKPNSYVVHAHMPGNTISNVKVSVDNGRLLKITGTSETNQQSSGFSSSSSSSFTQFVTLPGPVREEGITLDHKDGDLLITLPRA